MFGAAGALWRRRISELSECLPSSISPPANLCGVAFEQCTTRLWVFRAIDAEVAGPLLGHPLAATPGERVRRSEATEQWELENEVGNGGATRS
jgi:hypothetical protein